MNSLLTNLADELLVQDITEPSIVLGSLSHDEFEAAYDHVLEQFALELLIGAARNSDWSSSTPTTARFICSKLPSMLCGSKCGAGSWGELHSVVAWHRHAAPTTGKLTL